MTVEFYFAGFDDYHRIGQFLHNYWAKNHVYVRIPQLFEWTFARSDIWDHDGYSFAIAETKGEIIGILGAIPFLLNRFGHLSKAVWLSNYMVHPGHRRGPIAIRLLGMLSRELYGSTVAFGITPVTVPLYQMLGWKVLEGIPRHFMVFPDKVERMVELLRVTYPDWQADRAETLSRSFALKDTFKTEAKPERKLPPDWNDCDWPSIAAQTVGAARDFSYLRWRYWNHPCFEYRFITVPEGKRRGLAVWRLETIHVAAHEGFRELDRIGRLVEFLPVSSINAKHLLSSFCHDLLNADAFGADYYGYHGGIGSWLDALGFRRVATHPDGQAIPSRFQPLDRRPGTILSAVFSHDQLPVCSSDPPCVWYWTKSDADQDRPN